MQLKFTASSRVHKGGGDGGYRKTFLEEKMLLEPSTEIGTQGMQVGVRHTDLCKGTPMEGFPRTHI